MLGPSDNRKPILSLTAADFVFDTCRGSGHGGQHRNKTETKVRCRHEPSGACGVAEDERSQHTNKRLAFLRCVRSEAFQKWLRVELSRLLGYEAAVEAEVDRMMQEVNLRIEQRNEDGRWVPWSEPKE